MPSAPPPPTHHPHPPLHRSAHLCSRPRRQRHAITLKDIEPEGCDFGDADIGESSAVASEGKQLCMDGSARPSTISGKITRGPGNGHVSMLPASLRRACEACNGNHRPRKRGKRGLAASASAKNVATETAPVVVEAAAAQMSVAPALASSAPVVGACAQEKVQYRKILLKRLLKTLEVCAGPYRFMAFRIILPRVFVPSNPPTSRVYLPHF